MDFVFPLLILLGFFISLCTLVSEKSYKAFLALSLIHHLSMFVYILMSFPGDTPDFISIIYENEFLYAINFYIDGTSRLFILVTSFIGLLVNIYTHSYFSNNKDRKKAIGLLHLFSTAMIGLVSADNLIFMFVFWEMTTIISFLLIQFNHESQDAKHSSLKALMVTGLGGLCLLAGIFLLGQELGTLNASRFYSGNYDWALTARVKWAMGLILIGAFTKSAQFPFHFWLPSAMAAPAPISSYLHSATMVKAGIFLLLRLHPLFSNTDYFQGVIVLVGLFTSIWSIFLSFKYDDLKQILAYSTVSALGILVFLIGIGSDKAIQACVVFFIVHACYKAGLFMCVGSLGHIFGTRDITRLAKLVGTLPTLGTSYSFLCFSFIGLPGLIGFIAKEQILEAIFYPGPFENISIIGIIILNVLTIATGMRLFSVVVKEINQFTRPLDHAMPFISNIGPIALAFISLVLGIFPNLIADFPVVPALNSITNELHSVSFAHWHGFNNTFNASVLCFAGGAWLFYRKKKAILWAKFTRILPKLDRLYELDMKYMIKLSEFSTKLFFPHSYQKGLLLALLLPAATIIYLTFLFVHKVNIHFYLPTIEEILIAVLTIVPLMFAIKRSATFNLVLAVGTSGLGVSLLYFYYSAPDLALTQILIETTSLVIFVIISKKIYRPGKTMKIARKLYVLTASFFVALCLSIIVCFLPQVPLGMRISRFFAENSFLQAKGKNVVNVILVDFRAFDTLGEIAVLAIALIGVTLLVAKNKKEDT